LVGSFGLAFAKDLNKSDDSFFSPGLVLDLTLAFGAA
jgi:hypothetical protein